MCTYMYLVIGEVQIDGHWSAQQGEEYRQERDIHGYFTLLEAHGDGCNIVMWSSVSCRN